MRLQGDDKMRLGCFAKICGSKIVKSQGAFEQSQQPLHDLQKKSMLRVKLIEALIA